MNSSPGSPIATGWSFSSNTKTDVCIKGLPIGTPERIRASSSMEWQQVKVVFSVGPYPLISTPGPNSLSALRTCGTLSTSPPARICRTPFRRSRCWSTIKLNSPAVNHTTLTRFRSMVSTISCSVGLSWGCSTRVAPFNNAPQISSVEASMEILDNCRKTWSGPKGRKFCSRTNRTTARWGTTTPLGVPVEPDVYMM